MLWRLTGPASGAEDPCPDTPHNWPAWGLKSCPFGTQKLDHSGISLSLLCSKKVVRL